MQEDFLHYIWKYALFASDRLVTTRGERVEVLSNGGFNTDSGPDFLFARIRINQTVWAGHVEIHVRASDWYRHRHDTDPSYDPVVLHVVYEADCEVKRSNGDSLPTIVLPFKPAYLDNYHRMLSTLSPVPCTTSWMRLPSIEVENWLVNLGIERMESKASQIRSRLNDNRGGWEETSMQLLFRTFGFGVNQETFDRLGRSIPVKAIRITGDNLFRLEAILFGQGGLIPSNGKDSYLRALAAEYDFIRNKYNINTLERPEWKFLRMRPGNFPTVRLAQLAALVSVVTLNPSAMSGAFFPAEIRVSGYWKKHYDFGKEWKDKPPRIGEDTINILRINYLNPLLACYRSTLGNRESHVWWMEQLEALPPENNRITRLWSGYGFRVPNAFYSQAFLHLYRHYCSPRKCLNCRIGQAVVSSR
ncbi:MAG: DUF2851 family protein [Bacteroidales bacterium]